LAKQRFDAQLNKLGNNFQVNHDGSYASQRHSSITADRLGHACVVWSDSSGADWDIKGQIIEHTGEFRDLNFEVNLDHAGKQLHPDVAADGSYLYLTWADNRNGNYDIYGRIMQYNNPSLIASPIRLEFARDMYGPEPAPKTVTLGNAGYGELDYRLKTDQSWIILSETAGITPDSFQVSINSTSLDYGMHHGIISLIDYTHFDSTDILPVVLTITGPEIDLEPDSLNFRALAEVGPPPNQNMIVNNGSSGSLDWILSKTEPWITVDKSSGSAGELVSVGIDISLLVTGKYSGYIIISDDRALNSPESLKVAISLQTNMSYLVAQPIQISKTLTFGESYSDSVRILNLGNNVSYWRAGCDAAWISFNPDSGSDNDIFGYTIESSLMSPGYYNDNIIVADSLAFNYPILVPLEMIVQVTDSVIAPPTQAEIGKPFQMQMYLHTNNDIRSGQLEFLYDPLMLTVDSMLPTTIGELAGRISVMDSMGSGDFSITILTDSVDLNIEPGQHHLADLYMTANDSLTGTTFIDRVLADGLFYLDYPDDARYSPPFEAGAIDISGPTAIEEEDIEAPLAFSLGQNFPNPFRSTYRVPVSFDWRFIISSDKVSTS
jgi:hypothetical protein